MIGLFQAPRQKGTYEVLRRWNLLSGFIRKGKGTVQASYLRFFMDCSGTCLMARVNHHIGKHDILLSAGGEDDDFSNVVRGKWVASAGHTQIRSGGSKTQTRDHGGRRTHIHYQL